MNCFICKENEAQDWNADTFCGFIGAYSCQSCWYNGKEPDWDNNPIGSEEHKFWKALSDDQLMLCMIFDMKETGSFAEAITNKIRFTAKEEWERRKENI